MSETRAPALAEVLRAAIENALFDVHTALPGRVENYDAAAQTIDVKPLLKRIIVLDGGNEITEEIPVIRDVPVIFPRAGGFFISFPIQAGDHVLLIFNERSIDKFVSNGGDDPDLRMHDISDAVAIPGFYPFSKAIIDANNTDLVLGKDQGGIQIKIKDGGILEVVFNGGKTIQVENKDSNAKLTVGNGAVSVAIADHLQQLYTSIKSAFDNHTHATGVGPSGPPLPVAMFPAWNAAINSTKVKIPDG